MGCMHNPVNGWLLPVIVTTEALHKHMPCHAKGKEERGLWVDMAELCQWQIPEGIVHKLYPAYFLLFIKRQHLFTATFFIMLKKPAVWALEQYDMISIILINFTVKRGKNHATHRFPGWILKFWSFSFGGQMFLISLMQKLLRNKLLWVNKPKRSSLL